MSVYRVDRGGTAKATKLPNGYLRVDGFVTRTGVFSYKDASGKVRKEYRPPEEVFKADALASFALAPLTLGHPPELLNAKNTKKYQVGSVSSLEQDGKLAAAHLLVTDEAAVEEATSGRSSELSGGYFCDVDETPGTSPDGEHYDGIQRNIVGNHVALVSVGRAGPLCRVHLDGADAVEESFDTTQVHNDGPGRRGDIMRKIRIDGIEFEVSESVAQAIEKAEGLHGQKLAAAVALAEKEKGRADGAESEAKKEKARADLASDPKEIAKIVTAKTALIGQASKILGAGVKLDEKSDDEIKKLVVAKVWPDAKLDGVSADYLAGRFESAVSLAAKSTTDYLRVLVDQPHGDAGGDQDPVATARNKEHTERASAWQRTLEAAKPH